MSSNDLLIDAFERIKGSVHHSMEGLSEDNLAFRPDTSANSIAWLVWHLTRIQDDHMADLAGSKQLWQTTWQQKFDLPFDPAATGYGQSSKEVALVRVDADLLAGYYDAVHQATITYLKGLKPGDYDKVVDTNWDPPVTLGVRLVSVITDDLQHAGQAAYVRGLIK